MPIFSPETFDPAIRPMLERSVSIEAPRPGGDIRGTFSAAVFAAGFDAPISEMGSESTRRTITVVLAKIGANAWPRPTDPPRPGDIITLEDGSRYAILKRDHLVDAYHQFEAREI